MKNATMKILERQGYRDEYGVSTNAVSKLKEGETLTIKVKEKPDRVIKCIKINGKRSNRNSMVIAEGRDRFLLDLMPHWERGPKADIKLCHEGAVNLINAIYAQTENDYEQLYLAGAKAVPLERNYWENAREFEVRRLEMYRSMMADCEEFLGDVFVKYAKVRALWSMTHDTDWIASRIGETPYHVSCIVDRLGLNRAETAQNETEDY